MLERGASTDRDPGLPDGVARLELPLAVPGLPPVNAWALRAGDGVVLVDCGVPGPDALAALDTALAGAGHALGDVRLLVCTHAHPDHVGQAAAVVAATGCELWVHADHRHGTLPWPAEVARRLELARRAGVPARVRRAYAAAVRAQDPRVPPLPPVARALSDGVEVATDAGVWHVVETPGHAPSHVCLWEPGRRLLLTGDHLLAEPFLHLDVGWTPDPVGELGASLARVEQLAPAVCLPGHGPPFTTTAAALERTRDAVLAHLGAIRGALAGRPRSAFELAVAAFAEHDGEELAGWRFLDALAYARHLEAGRIAVRHPETWSRAAPGGHA